MYAMPVVVIAPDKFKGSLSAPEVAAAVARGISRTHADVELRLVPVADGGDGTLDAALGGGYDEVKVLAAGPTGEPLTTRYARQGTTAVVELADVSGLSRLADGLDALRANSVGTGQVIAAALDAGCRRIILGVGGSACTDGGAGLLVGLGARVVDRDGNPVADGGGGLLDAAHLDLSGLHPALGESEIVVACDVDNPLTGAHGAAATYAPQKGATPADVELLDRSLAHWADLVAGATGTEHRDDPGAGAAGGVAFAAVSVLGAQLRPGIDLVLDLLDFRQAVSGSTLVIVGEGSLDDQTLHGKAPVGVAAVARSEGAEVVAVCGRRLVTDEELHAVGISRAYACVDLVDDPARSMSEAPALLEQLGATIAADYL